MSHELIGLLEELERQVSQHQPSDVLQFCANHFNKKLESERTAGSTGNGSSSNNNDDTSRQSSSNSLGSKGALFGSSFGSSSTSQQLPQQQQTQQSQSSRLGGGLNSGFGSNSNNSSLGQSREIGPISEEEYDPADPASSSSSYPQHSDNSQSYTNTSQSQPYSGQQQQQQKFQQSRFQPPSSPTRALPTTSLFNTSPRQSLDNNTAAHSAPNDANNPNAGYPPNYNMSRRTSVSAESMAPSTAVNKYNRVMIPKTPGQAKRIMQSISNNFLFRNLDDEQTNEVLDAMEEKRVKNDGEVVIQQGDVGDFFYIVETGNYDIYISPNPASKRNSGYGKRVASIGPGGSFGELALMYNAPRAATVVSSSAGSENTHTDQNSPPYSILWALDRITFRRILMELTSRKRRMYEKFLETVPLLKTLEPYERQKIADALEGAAFERGSDVIRQGDVGELFYIVESGEANVVVNGRVEAKLTRGDYFGERALLNDAPRAATITALTTLKVASLDKGAFHRLLGPVALWEGH